MIACIEHLVAGVDKESPPAANCDDVELDVAIMESLDVAGAVDFSAAAAARCAADFGGLRHLPPIAVVFPACPDDVARVVRAAARSRRLTVAARGNGHSMSGQATAPGGVVVEMGAMGRMGSGDVAVHRWRDGYVADVGGGVLWEELLRACIGHGLAPRSWTDYLGLTVGGTLSNAGVSGQAFRHGPQTSNVTELQVVTGAGDVVTCSEVQHSDLFHAVLGGLGQFGVITRALVVLEPAPDMVRWVRLVYSNFTLFSSDAESLVAAAGADVGFDYVEGFVFVNSDDPVNGWGTVPIGDRRRGSAEAIPAGAGPVLYCLEVGYYYRNTDGFGVVDEAVEERLRPLRFVSGHRYDCDVGYVDFLGRVNAAEAVARAAGTWVAPHQWLNLFVPKRDIADFDRIVFQSLLKRGVGGPMLVYPLLRSKWDRRTSVVLPEVEGEVFYLVALLRFNRPYPQGPAVEQLQAENQAVVDLCAAAGLGVKLYLPHYRSEEQWRRHFGQQWGRFVERKARYDPLAVLAPGQRIFARQSSAGNAAPPPF